MAGSTGRSWRRWSTAWGDARSRRARRRSTTSCRASRREAPASRRSKHPTNRPKTPESKRPVTAPLVCSGSDAGDGPHLSGDGLHLSGDGTPGRGNGSVAPRDGPGFGAGQPVRRVAGRHLQSGQRFPRHGALPGGPRKRRRGVRSDPAALSVHTVAGARYPGPEQIGDMPEITIFIFCDSRHGPSRDPATELRYPKDGPTATRLVQGSHGDDRHRRVAT